MSRKPKRDTISLVGATLIRLDLSVSFEVWEQKPTRRRNDDELPVVFGKHAGEFPSL